MRTPRPLASAPILASLLLLASCAPVAPPARPGSGEKRDVVAAARLSGTVLVPRELGTTFRVATAATASEEVPGVSALIYLSAPSGELLAFGGQSRIATTVDAAGTYTFKDEVPVGIPVFVTAVLPENRRLTGYTVTQPGENKVEVSLASTYVAHLLARKAREMGKKVESYPTDRLADLVRLTREQMKDGRLGIPDLAMGAEFALSHTYAAAISEAGGSLAEAWTSLLGAPLRGARLVATRSGTFRYLGGAAAADDGTTYWSNFVQVFRQKASGEALEVVAGDADRPVMAPPTADGTEFAKTYLNAWTIALDPDGNLLVSQHFSKFAGIGCLCLKTGVYYGVPMEAGRYYRVAGSTPAPPGVLAGDGGPARDAMFSSALTFTADDTGNLYVLDQLGDAIRRVDRGSGIVTTIARTKLGDPVSRGDLDVFRGSWTSAWGVQWRRSSRGDEELYWLDFDANRIGRLTLSGGAAGKVDIVAGSSTRGFAGDGGSAADARVSFPLWSDAGTAMDRQRGRLYFFDSGNRRIRMLDLEAGTIDTVAGGGERVGDGEALSLNLTTIGNMAVAPDGDLLFSDLSIPGGMRVFR